MRNEIGSRGQKAHVLNMEKGSETQVQLGVVTALMRMCMGALSTEEGI